MPVMAVSVTVGTNELVLATENKQHVPGCKYFWKILVIKIPDTIILEGSNTTVSGLQVCNSVAKIKYAQN